MRLSTSVVSIVIAMLVGAAAGWMIGSQDIPPAVPPTDRAVAAAEALESSHIYISPEVDGIFDDTQLRRITMAAEAADPDVTVVAWHDSSDTGYYWDRQALEAISGLLDRPGTYIAVGPTHATSVDVGIAGGFANQASIHDYLDEDEPPVLDGTRLTRLVLDTIERSNDREVELADTLGSDYYGGTVGAIGIGLTMGVLAGICVAAVVGIAWAVLGHRRRSR